MHHLHWPLILTVAFAVVGCRDSSRRPNPAAEAVKTVSSLADATRRLELQGYSNVKESWALGLPIVTYSKSTSEAAYSVNIMLWSGDQRLRYVIFSCGTNEPVSSKESRRLIWDTIDADVGAVINRRQDYLRAVADMKEVKGEGLGLTRFEGRATTAEGGQILVIEYAEYYKILVGGKDNKIPFAMVELTYLATQEDAAAASAVSEFNRQMEEAKSK